MNGSTEKSPVSSLVLLVDFAIFVNSLELRSKLLQLTVEYLQPFTQVNYLVVLVLSKCKVSQYLTGFPVRTAYYPFLKFTQHLSRLL